jgi:hypothetical protein
MFKHRKALRNARREAADWKRLIFSASRLRPVTPMGDKTPRIKPVDLEGLESWADERRGRWWDIGQDVLLLLDAYRIVRAELLEASLDHDPPTFIWEGRREWCSACNNWWPSGCTAWRATTALSKADDLLSLSAEAGDTPCPTCKGRGCEEGCGHCDETPSVAGPNAHRQCVACHGSGLSAEAGDTDD